MITHVHKLVQHLGVNIFTKGLKTMLKGRLYRSSARVESNRRVGLASSMATPR
jgi:hypothetical protein